MATENQPVYLDDSMYSDSMSPNGWVVITHVNDRDIVYGGFNSKEDALKFGSYLVNAKVQRMFFPSIH